MNTIWEPGQRATIDRRRVVTIERVTPSGRAVLEGHTFGRDGREIATGDYYRRAVLELLTPGIEAEMALVVRGALASRAAIKALEDADRWLRDSFGSFDRRMPKAADVDTAERLVAAIRKAMKGVEK